MDSVATQELARTLTDALISDFALPANAEDFTQVLGTPAKSEGPGNNFNHEKVYIVGASNCKRLCKELQDTTNLECIDMCKPGWIPSEDNIALLEQELSSICTNGSIVICDLLSNVIFRFEQFDGTLSMPYKTQGTYHMGGKVCVCGRDTIVNLIGKLKNVLAKFTGKKIILPPLPRYAFNACCPAPGHCPGVDTDTYVSKLVEDTVGLRKHIVDGLVKAGITNFVVPSLVQSLVDESSDYKKMGSNLKVLVSTDGVHLNSKGYAKWASVMVKILCEHSTANSSIAGPAATSRRTFFWRGFTSPVGADRPKHGRTAYKQARSGGGKWGNEAHHWKHAKFGRDTGRGRGGQSRGRPY
jgi:hypothetical protein